MSVRRPAVVLAAGLLLGGGAAVAVGLGSDGPAPAPAPVAESTVAPQGVPAPTADPSAPPEPAEPSPTATPSLTAEPEPEAATEAEAVAPPQRVRIPAIDVDSRLLHLGLNDDGTIEVPAGKDIDRAAWFDGSPRPGQDGPAVVEGHVDSPNGASVFYRLSELEPGQEVHVDRRDGTTVTFVVDRVEQYAKDEFPTRQVYANTDGPELRVITCGGDWDASVGHYEDNTVVYAHAA